MTYFYIVLTNFVCSVSGKELNESAPRVESWAKEAPFITECSCGLLCVENFRVGVPVIELAIYSQ
jgi:hypothetical protein